MHIFSAERWINARDTILAVYTKYNQDNCAMLGAALAFHSFFSIFPLLLFFVYLGGDVLASSLAYDYLTTSLVQILPTGVDIITEIISTTAELRGPIGVIGVVGLVWSASNVFTVLEAALNRIWKAQPRAFWRKRVMATASILILSLLFIGSVSIGQFVPRLLALIPLPGLQWLGSVLAFLVLTFALYVFYQVFPNRTVPRRPALTAGLAAAAGITGARYIFDIFINSTFVNYGSVYGSVAWVVSLALWSYVVATIFLVGAEFGSVLEEKQIL
jgi:membrane protein